MALRFLEDRQLFLVLVLLELANKTVVGLHVGLRLAYLFVEDDESPPVGQHALQGVYLVVAYLGDGLRVVFLLGLEEALQFLVGLVIVEPELVFQLAVLLTLLLGEFA